MNTVPDSRIMLYAGDVDMACNFLGGEMFADALNLPVRSLIFYQFLILFVARGEVQRMDLHRRRQDQTSGRLVQEIPPTLVGHRQGCRPHGPHRQAHPRL